MKKLFTLALAFLASTCLFAETETHPSSAEKDADIVGTSYTIPGTYIAGIGGTKAGDMQTKGIKFRLSNKVDGDAKGFLFNVNEGYKITKLEFCGHVNDNSKTSKLVDVKVDGTSINITPVDLPVKTSSVSFAIEGFEAYESITLIFEGTGTQANLEYTVTYEAGEQKEIDHVLETLTGAAINGVALGETEMSTLLNNGEFEDPTYYVEAPTVTFTVQTDTYYVGEETPSTKSEDIDVVAELAAGMWIAQLTVNNEITYTIRATKPETRTITFMDGETVLGTEVVAKGDTSTKHADFETQPLTTFEGWFRNPDFTSQIDIQTYAINEDVTLYGKFTKAYAQSINIEQFVLDYGKGADIASTLTNLGYAYADINQLDSLNDVDNKANRNYAFLGLKLKKAGAYIQFNLQAGKTLAVKFGNLPKPVSVTIDGIAQADHTEGAFLLEEAEADRFIELKTTDASTVVLQQIMIGEAIEDVTLPAPGAYMVNIAETENGTVEANWENKSYRAPVGTTVTLTATPSEGYKVREVKVNETVLEAVEGVYSFTMPAEDVTVSATFEKAEEPVDGITNTTAAAAKPVKRIMNGKVVIEKNGKLYTTAGSQLR